MTKNAVDAAADLLFGALVLTKQCRGSRVETLRGNDGHNDGRQLLIFLYENDIFIVKKKGNLKIICFFIIFIIGYSFLSKLKIYSCQYCESFRKLYST